jgi:hypothetical protein
MTMIIVVYLAGYWILRRYYRLVKLTCSVVRTPKNGQGQLS